MASVSAVNPTQTAALFNGNHPSVNKNQTGGFEADFVSSVNADYQCPICQLPFREPVQTRDCGHRFCESCLEPILRKPPSLCPIDRRSISRDKVYPDKACKRTVLSLSVRCYNVATECFWTGELGNLPAHLEACKRVPIKCVNNCGRMDIPREEMAAHVDVEGECPLAVIPCKYHDIGCKVKVKRNELEKHQEDQIAAHLDLAHIRIHELEQRQEKICTNGKFLWKISNFAQLYQQSVTKKEKEKLCSPPFYSGQYGYKLRAEAFLNGLGQGKGTHLSLYVVIMKGDYDSVLPWPFTQRVDFILIDQEDDMNNRQNKSWRLTCDRNSDYFGKPNKAKSLGFGCPKFVSQETLKTRSYIRDNTVFIMIEVEPLDM